MTANRPAEALMLGALLWIPAASLADAGHGHGAEGAPTHQPQSGLHDGGAAHGHGEFSFGRPGNPGAAGRTIRIEASDAMRFSPQDIKVSAGETVRLVVTNTGRIRHELALGDAEAQRRHAEEMRRGGAGMQHDDPNAVSLGPGETRELVWTFTRPGVIEAACHEPGHYEAGMRGKIRVTKPKAGSKG